ncbi:hypothetical protein HZA33_04000, partial [Candidatus Pacearchaeota archaeon]|nr:hypothetical protein [Candidatus Pacearchaeota archaeon]
IKKLGLAGLCLIALVTSGCVNQGERKRDVKPANETYLMHEQWVATGVHRVGVYNNEGKKIAEFYENIHRRPRKWGFKTFYDPRVDNKNYAQQR